MDINELEEEEKRLKISSISSFKDMTRNHKKSAIIASIFSTVALIFSGYNGYMALNSNGDFDTKALSIGLSVAGLFIGAPFMVQAYNDIKYCIESKKIDHELKK